MADVVGAELLCPSSLDPGQETRTGSCCHGRVTQVGTLPAGSKGLQTGFTSVVWGLLCLSFPKSGSQ